MPMSWGRFLDREVELYVAIRPIISRLFSAQKLGEL